MKQQVRNGDIIEIGCFLTAKEGGLTQLMVVCPKLGMLALKRNMFHAVSFPQLSLAITPSTVFKGSSAKPGVWT